MRRRQELLDHIDEGTRQLRSGQGVELHGEDELRACSTAFTPKEYSATASAEHPMNRYVISPQAEADLQAIWDYIGIEHNSPDAASNQLRRFHEKLAALASQPLMGELRDDLRPGLRIFVADSYVVLYYPLNDGIEVVGVVHRRGTSSGCFGAGSVE